jgi:hypothetical protein
MKVALFELAPDTFETMLDSRVARSRAHIRTAKDKLAARNIMKLDAQRRDLARAAARDMKRGR